MSEISVLSWNFGRGMSKPSNAKEILHTLREADVDFVFGQEFCDRRGKIVIPNFAEQLNYEFSQIVPYEDEIPHPSGEQYLVAMGRKACRSRVIKLGGRNAIELTIDLDGREISLVNMHFDDRNEEARLASADALIALNADGKPRVVGADTNSFTGLLANVVSSAPMQMLAPMIPNKRIRSLDTRFGEMASGKTVRRLEANGFTDADRKHQKTMKLGGLAVAQFDRFWYNDQISVKDFEVLESKGSDHNPIRVTLELAD